MPHICFYWLPTPTFKPSFHFFFGFYVCMTASSCSFSVLQRPIKRNVLWAHGSISVAPPPFPLFTTPFFDAHSFLRLSAMRRTEVCYSFLWAAHKQKSCFLIPVCVIWRAQKLTMSGGVDIGGWLWGGGAGQVAQWLCTHNYWCMRLFVYPCELITFEQWQGPLWLWMWMWAQRVFLVCAKLGTSILMRRVSGCCRIPDRTHLLGQRDMSMGFETGPGRTSSSEGAPATTNTLWLTTHIFYWLGRWSVACEVGQLAFTARQK